VLQAYKKTPSLSDDNLYFGTHVFTMIYTFLIAANLMATVK